MSIITNPGNYTKTPVAESLNRIARQNAATAIQKLGKALPCSVVAVKGQVVKVKFEINSSFTIPQVTIPIATSRYDWLPVQPGDAGVTLPADAYLGGVSGLGGGTANLTPRANLTALVFIPCANAAWTVANPNQRVVQGPQGVVIKDTAGNAIIEVDNEGNVVVHGLKSYSWDINGYGQRITFTGGNTFRQDTYTTGAILNTVSHDWTPPGVPAP